MHNITVEFETDQNSKVHDLVRLILGIQGILSNSVSLTYSVHWDDSLDRESDPTENAAPF